MTTGDSKFQAPADERIVVGACIRWPNLVAEFRERLRAEHFYPGPAREAYAAIEALAERGEPALWTSVERELLRRAAEGTPHWGAYLLECLSEVVTDVHLGWHGLNVIRAAQNRRLLEAGRRVEHLANDGSLDADTAVAQAQRIIAGVADDSPAAASTLLDPTDLAILAAEHNAGMTDDAPLPFGLRDVDRKTLGGARRGQLVIVGGRTGFGKSALLRLMAHSFARSGPVLFASNEMTDTQLAQRDLAFLGRVPLEIVIGRQYRDGDAARLVEAEATMAHTPIHNWVAWGMDSASLRAMARELHSRLGLKAVVVDYLQKMADPGRTDLERVGHATRALKSLALELRLPVVVGAQINRKGEASGDDTNHRPTLVDLRDTGEIEQTADVVLLLYRANARYQANAPRGDNTAEIIIAKQRQGEAGTMVRVAWLPSLATFADLAHTS